MAPYELLEKQITPEGLLIQTPDQIHTETRVYFWSPVSFEGDVAVEFEFRPEQNTGLALLVVQATGLPSVRISSPIIRRAPPAPCPRSSVTA